MSSTRSYVPARLGLRAALAAALSCAALLAGTAASEASSWPPDPYPAAGRVAAAREFAAAAPGTVSFAVLDADGGLRGLDKERQFSSASVAKALLLAAELRRLRDDGERIDEETRSLLESMITVSDNDAAGSIYARVGDEGVQRVAERAGMRSFESTPGYWGGSQVTAGDLARFFFRLNHNLVGPNRVYARQLLAEITESQRWGIPAAAGARWQVYFKGGWRPPDTEQTSGPVTHQAALLRHRSGRRVAIAVLSDQSPGASSYETIEGITSRLLSAAPTSRSWPAN